MHIRPATVADIPSMICLQRESPTAAHWTEQQYAQLFQAGEGSGRLPLVVDRVPAIASDGESFSASNQRILGFLIAHHIAPEWELENIVVASAVRRKGLGSQLLEALLAAAREANSRFVFLEVRESNAAARTLYEKAGFEQTGRRPSYYTSPSEDAILYHRTLV